MCLFKAKELLRMHVGIFKYVKNYHVEMSKLTVKSKCYEVNI